MIVDLSRSWVRDAKCVGTTNPDLFFHDHGYSNFRYPSPKVQKAWDEAKQMCSDCPVRKQCARDSLGEVEGVWGGLDPAQRKSLRRKHAVNVRRLEGALKDEYIALVAHLRERLVPWQEVARIIGLPILSVQELYELHVEKVKAAKPQEKIEHSPDAQLPEGVLRKIIELRLGGMTISKIGQQTGVNPRTVRRHLGLHAPEIAGLRGVGAFPGKAPDEADGWVRHEGSVLAAYYLGETEDGAWFFMKVRISTEYSTGWFRAEDVRVVRNLPKQLRQRIGKASRIYGTTISSQGSEQAAG